MQERIYKVTNLLNGFFHYETEDQTLVFNASPSPEEIEALADDLTMYAVYQHGKTFSSRITPQNMW